MSVYTCTCMLAAYPAQALPTCENLQKAEPFPCWLRTRDDRIKSSFVLEIHTYPSGSRTQALWL